MKIYLLYKKKKILRVIEACDCKFRFNNEEGWELYKVVLSNGEYFKLKKDGEEITEIPKIEEKLKEDNITLLWDSEIPIALGSHFIKLLKRKKNMREKKDELGESHKT